MWCAIEKQLIASFTATRRVGVLKKEIFHSIIIYAIQ